jgi:putative peptidoglycan lipid II flippase
VTTPSLGPTVRPLSGSKLLQVSTIVALGTLLSRVTGLFRIVFTAAALGDDRVADAYNLANVAPNIVYELLIGGVLSATLVPLFVRANERGDKQGPDAITSLTFGALVALTSLSIAAAPALAYIFGAQPTGAANDHFDLLNVFLYLILPEIFFYGLTALLTAALHAQRRYLAAAFVPVLNNLVVIGVMTFAAAMYNECVPIAGDAASCSVESGVGDDSSAQMVVGLGTTAGIFMMTFALVLAVRRAGIRYTWRWEPRNPMVRDLARLAGWTVGYVATNQIALFAILRLATRDGEGTVTAYQNALVFFQLPHGLIAVTIMTTFLPEMSTAAAEGDFAEFRRRFTSGTRLMLAPLLSAVALMFVLGQQLAVFTLVRGAFGEELGLVVGRTLSLLVLGLPAFSVYLFVFRGFYALENTKTPFLINIFENALNIAIAVALASMGAEGLAIAYAVAYTIAVFPALWALHKRVTFNRSEITDTLTSVARSLALAVAVGVVAAVAAQLVSSAQPLMQIVVAGLAGGVVFIGVGIVVNVDGISQARAALTRRFSDRS